jgi:hypothetical protein
MLGAGSVNGVQNVWLTVLSYQYGVPRIDLLPEPTVAKSSIRLLAPKSASFTVPLLTYRPSTGVSVSVKELLMMVAARQVSHSAFVMVQLACLPMLILLVATHECAMQQASDWMTVLTYWGSTKMLAPLMSLCMIFF